MNTEVIASLPIHHRFWQSTVIGFALSCSLACSTKSDAEPTPACDICKRTKFTCPAQPESYEFRIEKLDETGCYGRFYSLGKPHSQDAYHLACDSQHICKAGDCDAGSFDDYSVEIGSQSCYANP